MYSGLDSFFWFDGTQLDEAWIGSYENMAIGKSRDGVFLSLPVEIEHLHEVFGRPNSFHRERRLRSIKFY